MMVADALAPHLCAMASAILRDSPNAGAAHDAVQDAFVRIHTLDGAGREAAPRSTLHPSGTLPS